MAGGKQTPRQKMINLMYLVFIAMLALNMSKEVLSAFGSINEKLDRANTSYASKNSLALAEISKKADENDEFKAAAATANAASQLSKTYNDYIALQKEMLLSEVEDNTDYETMDTSGYLDALYYEGGKITEAGQEFLNQMDTYRDGMVALLGDTNPTLTSQINVDFSSADITDGDGVVKDYISYNYVAFPMVSSLTKMTQIQNDIKSVENELLSTLLSGNLKLIGNLSNYETVMTTSKGAYYTGSTFDGMLSLGRVDASTKPARVELLLDGKEIKDNQYEFDGGRLVLKVGTGSVGDHTISGKLIYLQDGNEVEVLVDKKFTTINKPNAATISADKMNVVYRGVSNPMTITFAGIQDKDIRANAPGLSRVKGSSYKMNVTNVRDTKVNISVSGKLPGGATVSDKATFRIKDIPAPEGLLRGRAAPKGKSFKLPSSSLVNAKIGAGMAEGFDFELPLKVEGFTLKIPGEPEIRVTGNRFNDRAKSALNQVEPGVIVFVTNIKAVLASGSDYKLPPISQMLIEIAD
ncbi:gliding motility protein GldM [Flavobacteriaceae bacterium]|nr:gliding motility protein GldM [Flavobacteriaceae bacterium]